MIDLRLKPSCQLIVNISKQDGSLRLFLLLILHLVPFLPGVMIFPNAHFVELCPALSLLAIIIIAKKIIKIKKVKSWDTFNFNVTITDSSVFQ